MTVIAWIPLLVAIVSALLYCISANPNVKQLAGWAFLASMIALMFWMTGQTVKIGHGP